VLKIETLPYVVEVVDYLAFTPGQEGCLALGPEDLRPLQIRGFVKCCSYWLRIGQNH